MQNDGLDGKLPVRNDMRSQVSVHLTLFETEAMSEVDGLSRKLRTWRASYQPSKAHQGSPRLSLDSQLGMGHMMVYI